MDLLILLATVDITRGYYSGKDLSKEAADFGAEVNRNLQNPNIEFSNALVSSTSSNATGSLFH